MPISRVAVISGALLMAAAVTMLPVGIAGAQTPSTFVAIPSNNATVSGTSQILDAGAASGVTKVQYEISGGTLNDSVIATATPTIYGWLAKWNTTTVANGTYTLQSVATANGVSGTSAPVTIMVNNPPPSTEVIIPANGATLDNTKGWVIDAIASAGVTSVSIVATPTGGGLTPATYTASPTIYGWVVQDSAFPPCAGCIPYYIPLTIQSVASYSGGVKGTSAPITATNVIYLPPDIA